MCRSLTSRSADLKRLRDEGYAIEVRDAHLLVHDVPYVAANQQVRRGVLVSTLHMAGEATTTPDTHVAHFIGETPRDRDGRPLDNVINSSGRCQLAPTITVDHLFSAKPRGRSGYTDYYEKVTTYVTVLSAPAAALDPTSTAKTFRIIEAQDDDSPFAYVDTSSSRAGITATSEKLRIGKLAIVGLGGSGAYILDLVAKTPVAEIHLFDGDKFFQHNAFRSPGAASIEELVATPCKVDYYSGIYSKMRQGISPHAYYVDEENASDLEPMEFVFVAVDNGDAKRPIVAALERAAIPFIDVGMGLHETGGSIGGVLRVTTSTPAKRDHLHTRVSLSDTEVEDEYAKNIQIADLNALNATLAVIKWKKLFGFYGDLDHEHHTTFTIDGNLLLNEENPW